MSDDYKKIPWWTFTYPEHFDIANKVYSRRSWWGRAKELMHETFNPDKKDFSYHIFLAVLGLLLYVAILYDNWNRVTYGYFLVTIPMVCAVEAFLLSLAVEYKKKINRRKRIQDKWNEKQKQSKNTC